MQTAISITKKFIFLTASLAIALAANVVFGQWSDPTGTPPSNNAEAPLNTSGDYQIKSGDLGVGGMYVSSTTHSDRYCNLAGDECFTANDVLALMSQGPATPAPVVSGTCQVRFTSTINGSQTDTETLIRGENAGIGVWGHCDDSQNARFTKQFRYEKWGAAWNDHSEKAGTGYYTQTQYENNVGTFSRDRDIATSRFMVEEGETGTISKSACGRTVRITASVLSCEDDEPEPVFTGQYSCPNRTTQEARDGSGDRTTCANDCRGQVQSGSTCEYEMARTFNNESSATFCSPVPTLGECTPINL